MPGPAPKPDAERRRRNESTFEWVLLPAAGRQGDAPDLPEESPGGRNWLPGTRAWWSELWLKPQATQWDPSSMELARLAALHDKFWRGEAGSGDLSEMRQIEDRHGLSPKALLQLRWRIVDEADVMPLPAKSVRKQRLKVVDAG